MYWYDDVEGFFDGHERELIYIVLNPKCKLSNDESCSGAQELSNFMHA